MHRTEASQVLGVPLTASEAEVKRKVRELVKRFHPDLAGTNANQSRLTQVIEAYAVFRNSAEATSSKSRWWSGRASRPTTARKQNHAEYGYRLDPEELLALGRQALDGDTPNDRIDALRRLAALRSQICIGYFEQALHDRDYRVVIVASEEMILRWPDRAAAILERTLPALRPATRSTVGHVLRRNAHISGVVRLLSILDFDGHIRGSRQPRGQR